MNGLSKTERQRAKIKALRAEVEEWETWGRALLDAPEDVPGPALRRQIATVWEATRARVDAETDRLGAGYSDAPRPAINGPEGDE